MGKWFPIAILLLISVGCNQGSHEDITREYLGVMSKLVDVCEKIKDKDSAKAAQGDLEKLLASLRELKSRANELGEVEESVQQNIEKKFDAEFESLSKRYTNAIRNMVESEEVSSTLESELKTLANLLNTRFAS